MVGLEPEGPPGFLTPGAFYESKVVNEQPLKERTSTVKIRSTLMTKGLDCQTNEVSKERMKDKKKTEETNKPPKGTTSSADHSPRH